MKKSIIFTASAVLGITAIVAVSIFVPAARTQIGNNPIIVQNVKTFNPYTAPNTTASFQEALEGTTTVNGGNYVLYVGSLAYADNTTFLLGNQTNGNSYSVKQLATNNVFPLNGSFGKAIQQMDQNAKQFKIQPTFLAYLNLVTPAEQQAAINYQKMVNTYKNQTPPAGATTAQINQEQKQQSWANNAPIFSYAPGATYTNWQGKTVPFYLSPKNTLFQHLVAFIQAQFPKMANLNNTPGFIIGYHDGKPNTLFASSYKSQKGSQVVSFYTWLQANYGKSGSTK